MVKKKIEKKCEKKMEQGVKVLVNNVKYFKDHEAARRYACKLLEAGVTFLSIDVWEYEKEEKDC